MPLTILVPLVAIGLFLVFLCVRFFGNANIAEALDERTATSRFAEDYPGFSVDRACLGDDGKTAFLFSGSDGRIGLVHTVGRHYLTRMLEPGMVRAIEQDDTGLRLSLADFTLNSVYVNVSDRSIRENLAERLGGLSAKTV
jgi:hypothetical protein